MTNFITLFLIILSSVFGIKTQDLPADRHGSLPITTNTIGYAQVEVVIKPESLNINPGILTVFAKFPEPFGVPQTLNATLDGGALNK